MGYQAKVWNVRQFSNNAPPARIAKVAALVARGSPDVFALIEFRAKDIARELITERFPAYDFAITDSERQLDFLVGWKRGRFAQVLFTQRREFQAQDLDLRPGGLLSFREPRGRRFHNLLVLHTDSGREDLDYRNRQAMFQKVWSLKRALAALPIQAGQARLVAVGDLNTMGRKRVGSRASISAAAEIAALGADAAQAGMRILSKSSAVTYRSEGGSLVSDLDHAIASRELRFTTRSAPGDPSAAVEVEVQGWVELAGAAQTAFVRDVSDHSALAFETR